MNQPNPYEALAVTDDIFEWRRKLGTTFGGIALTLGVTLSLLVTLQTVGLCQDVATMDAPVGEIRPIPLVALGMVSFGGPFIVLIPIGILSRLAKRLDSSRGLSLANYGAICVVLPIPIFFVGVFVFFWICRSRGF